jgi:hypothetical protein
VTPAEEAEMLAALDRLDPSLATSAAETLPGGLRRWQTVVIRSGRHRGAEAVVRAVSWGQVTWRREGPQDYGWVVTLDRLGAEGERLARGRCSTPLANVRPVGSDDA